MPSIVVANPDAVCVQIEKWADFREAWAAITTGRPCEIETDAGEVQPALAVKLGGEEFTIQTVIVDTMTDLQRLAFASMIGADAGKVDRLDFDKASNNLSIDKHGILFSSRLRRKRKMKRERGKSCPCSPDQSFPMQWGSILTPRASLRFAEPKAEGFNT